MQIKTPKQERSREALSKILDAAERVMTETTFSEDVSLKAILENSGVSVGSFYARFDSKEAAFAALYLRVLEEFEQAYADLWSEVAAAPLATRVDCLVRTTAELYTRRAGVARSMLLHFNREVFEPADDVRRALRTIGEQVGRILSGTASKRSREADDAVEFCVLLLSAALRDRIVFRFQDRIGATLSTDAFLTHLSDALIARLSAVET